MRVLIDVNTYVLTTRIQAHWDWRAGGSAFEQVPLMRSRSLLHRSIFQNRCADLPVQEFTHKGPTDIILINRPERSWNEAPQQGKKSWGVCITRDDPGAKNC